MVNPSRLVVTLDLVREPDDESVPVRHLYLRQCLGVHRVVLADQLVERENVSGQSVDFLVGERPWLLPRHRASDVVEDCRRIGPEISDGLLRVYAGDWRTAHQAGADAAFAVLAVAGQALR